MIISKRTGLASFVMIVALALVNSFPVFASEVEKYDINKEIAERESLGAEISVFTDANGNIMGYFEPYSDINPAPDIMPHASANINWTIGANTYSKSEVTRYFGAGQRISLNISQSPSGAGYVGYLGLYDVSAGTSDFPPNTVTTNGWNGTFSPGYSGNFQFAIHNASPYTITYTGSYSW